MLDVLFEYLNSHQDCEELNERNLLLASLKKAQDNRRDLRLAHEGRAASLHQHCADASGTRAVGVQSQVSTPRPLEG